MRKELNVFFTALSFYTRVPGPKRFQNYSQSSLSDSIRYFPFIGWIVGFAASLTFIACDHLLGLPIALLLSIITSILLTGAFHEDAFADVCDGFGGGWTKERILEIMKDSRLGTYGVIGLTGILALKFLTLQQLITLPVFASGFLIKGSLTKMLLFITAHSVSRFTASTIIFTHSYVGKPASKAAPATVNPGKQNLVIAAFFGFLPLVALVILTSLPLLFLILLPLCITQKVLANYFSKWIGGYTGDCLGAVQQISELVTYLSFIILWKFT